MSLLVMAGERFKHIVKARRIADCNHMAIRSPMQRLPRPVAHHAPCARYHRNQSRKIMKLQAPFHDDVDMAAGKQCVIITITTKQHFLMRGLRG